MINHRSSPLGLGAVCMLALGAPATAQADAPQMHSFEGSCAIVGYAELRDRMTPVPTQSWFSYHGEGRCMGTLDGEVLPERGVPVRMASEGPRAVHSCAVGYDPGTTWQITFDLAPPRRNVTIHGDSDIVDVLRSQNSVFRGQRDGIGVAVNTIQGHGETLERCFSEGVTAGSVGIQLDTVTPLVSDEPAGAPRGDRPDPPGSDRRRNVGRAVRLSVQPRRVRVGKPARVRFRATALSDSGRRPVRGATIRVAGARVTTDRHGRAAVVLRLRRAGSYRVELRTSGGGTAATNLDVVRSGRSAR